jgi:chemotaxis protein CheD
MTGETMEVRRVKMAQIEVAEVPVVLKTTLGSCVGVVLHDGRARICGLAHVVLPRSEGRDDSPGKYADTAIPALLEGMGRLGSRRQHVTAFLAGGAAMFRGSADGAIATIGDQNVQAVRRILADLRIPISAEDTGGGHGRTIAFDASTASFDVTRLEAPRIREEAR